MITKDELRSLALAAVDDADARAVLADAIHEHGWWDDRLAAILHVPDAWARRWTVTASMLPSEARAIHACMMVPRLPGETDRASRRRVRAFLERGTRLDIPLPADIGARLLQALRARRLEMAAQAEAAERARIAAQPPPRGPCAACFGSGRHPFFAGERCPFCEGRGHLGEEDG